MTLCRVGLVAVLFLTGCAHDTRPVKYYRWIGPTAQISQGVLERDNWQCQQEAREAPLIRGEGTKATTLNGAVNAGGWRSYDQAMIRCMIGKGWEYVPPEKVDDEGLVN